MIYFPNKGLPKKKGFKSQTDTLTVCPTIWECEEVGSTKNAYTKMFELNPEIMFQTPKPLSFMERIVMIGSNEGDTVIDTYGGKRDNR